VKYCFIFLGGTVIPIDDQEVRGAGPGWVNWALIIINVLVFVLMITLSQDEQQAFIGRYGVIPAEILAGQNLLALLTSMFLHGGWLHLIGNMLYLWVFGDNIEAIFGHIGYLVFYLLGGLAGSAAHIALNPESTVPSVGASGAISAVLGAYLVMFPGSKIKALVFAGRYMRMTYVSALLFIGFWILLQFFNGFASLGVNTAQTGGVAYFAHIGGFVLGLLGGFLFRGPRARLA
jgi:membrane associated rhomboid family serine protease